jgi:hypothetical protein
MMRATLQWAAEDWRESGACHADNARRRAASSA